MVLAAVRFYKRAIFKRALTVIPGKNFYENVGKFEFYDQENFIIKIFMIKKILSRIFWSRKFYQEFYDQENFIKNFMIKKILSSRILLVFQEISCFQEQNLSII